MEQPFVSAQPTVNVQGEERAEVGEALINMVVNQPLNGMSHAELTMSNWGLPEGQREPDFTFIDIALGDRIEIFMGEESPTRILDGEITALEERYGEGAPQIVLLIQDKLHHLARQRHSRTFDEQSPDDVVQAIAGEAGFQSDVSVSTVQSTHHQINESNLAFLLRLLGRYDIALRLEEGTLRARAEDPDGDRIILDAQDNALRVRLLADLNHQQSTARTQGFNAGTNQPVGGSANALQPAPAGTTAADTLGSLGWAGEETMPQPFPLSQGEADAFATGHFLKRAKRFVSGDIQCQGDPSLRSGREVELEGVSERLSGVYRVVHSVHRFDVENGYETHIKVNRPDWQL